MRHDPGFFFWDYFPLWYFFFRLLVVVFALHVTTPFHDFLLFCVPMMNDGDVMASKRTRPHVIWRILRRYR